MATLCASGRISVREMEDEVTNLLAQWHHGRTVGAGPLEQTLGGEFLERFERVQLEDVAERLIKLARRLLRVLLQQRLTNRRN